VDYALHNVVGNIGVVVIVGTYFLVQIRKMSATQPPYILANGLGATLIMYSLWFDFNLSAFLIEAIWLLVSVVGLARVWRERRAVRRQLPAKQE
jgi:protein-S-isoprenylcysteine O-methyltransferase Ste14